MGIYDRDYMKAKPEPKPIYTQKKFLRVVIVVSCLVLILLTILFVKANPLGQ